MFDKHYSFLGTMYPIMGLLLIGMLSGCPATLPKVETKYVVTPCVKATEMPSEPLYTFEELSQPKNAKEEAEAIVALYSSYIAAKAYGDALRYLIVPCTGVKNENQ